MTAVGPIITHPGKNGDLLFALKVVRELVALYGAPATIVTSPFCLPVCELLKCQDDIVADVFVDQSYQAVADEPGLQPWMIDVPRQTPHRDVIHLGLRRHPWPGENIADAMGEPYQIKAKPGPWMKRARRDDNGHAVFSAPVTDVTIAPLMETWRSALHSTAALGRRVVLAGSPAECEVYESVSLNRLPGVEIRSCANLAEFADACNGAASFFGVASAPAVVAAAIGLPCDWIMRPGSDERWVPKGCDVRVVAPSQIVRPRLVAVGA